MKKSAIIAAAIAATVVSGVAQADTTMYGKVRLYLELNKEDGVAAGTDRTSVQNYSSRVGWKGSEDLGNGMKAIYKLETQFGDEQKEATAVRIAYAGLKGGFGQVAMGSQWTPSYSLVRGKHDPWRSRVGAGVYSGNFPAGGRTSDAISYMNKFGDVTFAMAIVADESSEELMDHTDIAVSLPIGPVSLGVAMAQSDASGSASPSAINVGYKAGGLDANLGFFQVDTDGDDAMAVTVKYKIGSGKITAAFEDDGTDTQTSLGYNHSLSKKTSLFAEMTTGDIAVDQTNLGIHVNF